MMNIRHFLSLSLALVLTTAVSAQKRPEAKLILNQKDIETQNSGESVQGTAIYGDLLFSMRNTGLCIVIDLKNKSLVAEFPLGSAGVQNHANDAFFTHSKYAPGDAFPLLYVSQCKDKPVQEIGREETASRSRLCFVERILTDGQGKPCGSELVQIIECQTSQKNSRLWAWDSSDPQWAWCYGNTIGNMKEGNRILVRKYRMPEFDKDKFLVTLTDADIEESFYVDEALPEGHRGPQDNILQGALVHKGLLYLPVGVGRKDKPSELFVIDLRKRDAEGKPFKYAYYDYNDVIPCELEDLDVWGKYIVCTTNSSGRVRPVFSFPIKEFRTKSK